MANQDESQTTHARAPDLLEHDELKARTDRLRIAWAETSEGTEQTKRERRKARDLAREWTPLAIATLVDVARNGESDAARVSAALGLLDRACGRPREFLEVDDRREAEAAKVTEQLKQLRTNPETAGLLLSLAEASAKVSRS